jgi:hypothetical protein
LRLLFSTSLLLLLVPTTLLLYVTAFALGHCVCFALLLLCGFLLLTCVLCCFLCLWYCCRSCCCLASWLVLASMILLALLLSVMLLASLMLRVFSDVASVPVAASVSAVAFDLALVHVQALLLSRRHAITNLRNQAHTNTHHSFAPASTHNCKLYQTCPPYPTGPCRLCVI